MKTPLKNRKGLTLVEVIASIVILTIILLSFYNFFPQMGKTNKQNENKQHAINLAQNELIHWEEEFNKDDFEEFLKNPLSSYSFTDGVTNFTCNSNEDCATVHPIEKISITTKSIQDPNYDVKIVLNVSSDLTNGPIKAYLTNIIIFNDNNENISETYGYIFHKSGD